MKRLVTAEEMKLAEQDTMERIGVPAVVLMERAACAVADTVKRMIKASGASQCRCCIVCGTGNNGADGLAAARLLAAAGYKAELRIVGHRDRATDLWKLQKQITENLLIPECKETEEAEYTIIVDALFGIGLSGEVSGRYRDAVVWMNEQKAFGAKVVSVDIPSGLNAATGHEMGVCVRADVTVTFQYCKTGMCLYPGAEYTGEIIISDVGILSEKGRISDCDAADILKASESRERPKTFELEEIDIQKLLPERRADTNKGSFGKVLVIAGSDGMCGAAYFAAAAAYRSGAGLVRIYTPVKNRIVLQTRLPEAIVTASEEEALEPLLSWATVICIGPGLSRADTGFQYLDLVLRSGKPVVLDADALNLMAERPEYKKGLGPDMIVTPHMGEMARLMGMSIPELKSDPVKAARDFSAAYQVICVLKDARTVTAFPDGTTIINTRGNAGMATGGAGDVLAGMITGLAAAKAEPKAAAVLGVFLHAAAGDSARMKRGMASMTAADILDFIQIPE